VDSKTSVLIANDFPLVRNSIRDLLNSTPYLEVVACATSKNDVLPLADAHQPQVSILDLDADWTELQELVKRLSERQIPALLMTDSVDDEKTVDLLRAGFNGVISRRVDGDLLCRSVRAVASGEIWMSRVATNQLLQRIRTHSSAAPAPHQTAEGPAATPVQVPQPPKNLFGLTRRELEIVRAIGEAMSNKDIAVHFGISEYTVKHHLTRIFDKIGVYSRLELAMMATHHGLVNTQTEAIA
jgi:two-component system, NarL family, nitrate/nitrite response regulator NarL